MRSPDDVAASGTTVHGHEGLRGRLGQEPQGAEGERQCLVHLERGGTLLVPKDLLERQPDGSLFLPLSPNDLEGYRTAEAGEAERPRHASTTIPLAAERLKVDKRVVETGRVVIHKTVAAHEEVIDEPLMSDRCEVERVAVNRVVRQAPSIRQEGDVTIVPLLEEVLLVQKKLMLREELRITRKRVPTRQPQRVTLRKEEARVERLAHPQTTNPVTETPTQERAG